METTTLQLRQEDSADVSTNGVWKNTLSIPTTLLPGDTVSIKSVYLNLDPDVISIPTEGLDVSLSCMKYLVNYNINQKFDYRVGNPGIPVGGVGEMFHYEDAPVAVNSETGDNQLYWLADAYTSDNHQQYYLMNVNVIPLTKGRGGKRYGGGSLSIQYTDVNDPTNIFGASISIDMPSYREEDYLKHNPLPVKSQAHKANPTLFVVIKCADIGGKPSIRMNPNQELFQQNIASVNFTETPDTVQPFSPAADSYEISPQIFKWSITIPGGDYTPTEMAAYLTSQLVPIEFNGATGADYNKGDGSTPPAWNASAMTFPSNTPFLETILQNNYNLNNPGGVAEAGHNQIFINASAPLHTDITQLAPIAGTVTREFNIANMEGEYVASPFAPPQDRWVGTDELAIVFDPDEKKLKVSVMHFPIYVNSTDGDGGATDVNTDAKPGIQYNELDGLNTTLNAPSGIAKAYGGIAFTDMQPSNFWSSQLGFGNLPVQINPNSAINKYDNAGQTVANSFTVSGVMPGETITEGLGSLAVPVITSSKIQYTGGTPGRFAQPIFTNGVGASLQGQITTGDTDAIFASKTYNDSIENAGYFLVDIAHNFQQPFIGSNNQGFTTPFSTTNNNTMSVVSRYYTSNNFVTDQGAGSVVYTHSGTPQKLTDLDIRIKNPDGSFVSDSILGGKNTVFLTIERAKQVNDLTSIPPASPPPKTK
jgi:hypothetical protein